MNMIYADMPDSNAPCLGEGLEGRSLRRRGANVFPDPRDPERHLLLHHPELTKFQTTGALAFQLGPGPSRIRGP